MASPSSRRGKLTTNKHLHRDPRPACRASGAPRACGARGACGCAQSMWSARSAQSVRSSTRSSMRSTLKSAQSFVRASIARHGEMARRAASRRQSTVESLDPEVGVRSRIKYVVTSAWFAIAMAVLILMNVILLGVEVDVGTSLLYASEVPSWFAIFNQVIAAWQFQCDPG